MQAEERAVILTLIVLAAVVSLIACVAPCMLSSQISRREEEDHDAV